MSGKVVHASGNEEHGSKTEQVREHKRALLGRVGTVATSQKHASKLRAAAQRGDAVKWVQAIFAGCPAIFYGGCSNTELSLRRDA